MANIDKKVKVEIENIIIDNNYELYDMEYVQEGETYFLRVYLETTTEERIGIEDCVKVTGLINKYLDKEDPIKHEYMLEVTSPGIIRKLKTKRHFEKQIGNKIKVKFYKKNEVFDAKKYEGILDEVAEDSIVIDGKEIILSDIAKAETTFEF